jgi:hypothetical protein
VAASNRHAREALMQIPFFGSADGSWKKQGRMKNKVTGEMDSSIDQFFRRFEA